VSCDCESCICEDDDPVLEEILKGLCVEGQDGCKLENCHCRDDAQSGW